MIIPDRGFHPFSLLRFVTKIPARNNGWRLPQSLRASPSGTRMNLE